MHRGLVTAALVIALPSCGAASGNKVAAEGTGDVSNPPAPRVSDGEAPAAGCGSGGLTARGEIELDRAPYLQRLSASSVELLFTADAPVTEPFTLALPNGRSIASATPELDPADPTGRQHRVRFAGLDPAQTYCYALGELTGAAAFRTAPVAGSNTPVRFGVFGDSGGGELQSAVTEQLGTVSMDLLLHVGDIAYGRGSLAQLEQQFFTEYAALLDQIPAFPVPGNHDYGTDDAAPFRQVFALPENGTPDGLERWYSFDFGDVHFVGLDTERVGAAQIEWLDEDLSRNALPWTVVFLHRPPFSSGDHGSSLRVRDAFVPLFERHGVAVVFAGHDHDYERTQAIEGVTYIVTGGGGHNTRAVGWSSFTAYAEDVLHFVYAEVEGDRLSVHAIDATGREFDSVRIDRTATVLH